MTKKWYNKELERLRIILSNRGRYLKINPNSQEIRHKYFSTLKQYRNKCKSRYRKFKTEILQKLDNLHGNNPTEYWKLVQTLNVKSKPQITFLQRVGTTILDFLNEYVDILNKLDEMENIPTCIEMLKCGKYILLRPLNRLFNSI